MDSKILVQVKRDSTNKKGARVSSHISLYGRFCVIMPNANFITISQKIENEKEHSSINKKKCNIKNQIATYDFSSRLSYKYGEYKCNFELTDEISKYGEILVEPITLQFKTFDNLYNILKSYTPNNDKFEISSDVLERFSYINSFYYSRAHCS